MAGEGWAIDFLPTRRGFIIHRPAPERPRGPHDQQDSDAAFHAERRVPAEGLYLPLTVVLVVSYLVSGFGTVTKVSLAAFLLAQLAQLVRRRDFTVSKGPDGGEVAFAVRQDTSVLSLSERYTVTDRGGIRLGVIEKGAGCSGRGGRAGRGYMWCVSTPDGERLFTASHHPFRKVGRFRLMGASGAEVGSVNADFLGSRYRLKVAEGAGGLDERLLIAFGVQAFSRTLKG